MANNYELPERAKNIYSELKEKSFGIKDIKKIDENNVRQLRYWISLGMLNGNESANAGELQDNSGWDKFNFYEFIWILIIRQLKEMNFDNSIISKSANEIFSRKDPKYKMLLFEKAVLFALTNRTDVFFVINKQGEFDVYRPEDLIKIAEKKEFSPHVLINLLPLMKGFLLLKDFRNYIVGKKLLKENETKTLELLSNDPKTEAKLILDGKESIMRAGENGIKDFIEMIFTRDYKKIIIQL
ncbi:MAG: hypothetical protein V4549_18950 [Bacteroidota bacterium]